VEAQDVLHREFRPGNRDCARREDDALEFSEVAGDGKGFEARGVGSNAAPLAADARQAFTGPASLLTGGAL
jgi:hypothetical protein